MMSDQQILVFGAYVASTQLEANTWHRLGGKPVKVTQIEKRHGEKPNKTMHDT